MILPIWSQTEDPYIAIARTIPANFSAKIEVAAGALFRGADEPVVLPDGTRPTSLLSLQKMFVRRFEAIIPSLHRVTSSPYQIPSTGYSSADFAQFKTLQKWIRYAIHVKFAEGSRSEAVSLIVDGLTFARRIRPASTNALLVGVACQSIILAQVKEDLEQIPLTETERLAKVASTCLAESVRWPSDLPVEASKRLGNGLPTMFVPGTEEESNGILGALLKDRIQMCLFRAHMRIEAYRWKFQKLPANLNAAMSTAETNDPATDVPLFYRPFDKVYELESQGFGELGPIRLRYRRPEGTTGAEPGAVPAEREERLVQNERNVTGTNLRASLGNR